MIKVIVADCTPSVYTVIVAAFPRTEFEIFTFSDGQKMLAEMTAIQPDVILLNLFLGSKDGYDVCRFLNSQEQFKAIPLFLLKGAFERIDEERIKGLEYRELLEEPFDSNGLLQKIRDVLGGALDPQTLPEDPVPSEALSMGVELEDKIKSLIAEQLRESEDRIVNRLKAHDLEGLKKEE
ncbi:MAG: response regulator [Candidatus Aminicenantes bacterium]|nr:response regulator [Candidatus Aminicenantes bacterium]